MQKKNLLDNYSVMRITSSIITRFLNIKSYTGIEVLPEGISVDGDILNTNWYIISHDLSDDGLRLVLRFNDNSQQVTINVKPDLIKVDGVVSFKLISDAFDLVLVSAISKILIKQEVA